MINLFPKLKGERSLRNAGAERLAPQRTVFPNKTPTSSLVGEAHRPKFWIESRIDNLISFRTDQSSKDGF